MVKALILSALLCLSTQAAAKTFIVELADFYCQFCKEAEGYKYKLVDIMEQNGDEFVFAPANFSNKSMILEVTYAVVKDDKNLEKYTRELFFEIAQKHRLQMETFEELIDWLNIYERPRNETSVEKIITKLKNKEHQNKAMQSYIKAKSLAFDVGIEQTPTFVIINEENGIEAVKRPAKMTIEEYIDHTINKYKRISVR